MPPKPSTDRRQEATPAAQVYRIRNQEVVVPAGCLAVGQIVGAHSLHGELKVDPYSDFPARFAPGATLLLGEELEPVVIEGVRAHKGLLLLKLEGIDDRTTAETGRGAWLFVREANASTLAEGEFWVHDIIGLRVKTDAGALLGRIVDVFTTGANDVYVIKPAPGVNHDRDLLIPALTDVVAAVDLEHGSMTVHLPAGLLDG